MLLTPSHRHRWEKTYNCLVQLNYALYFEPELAGKVGLSKLHLAASSLLFRPAINQTSCRHVFACMPHGLVNGNLVLRLSSRSPTEQKFTQLGADASIKSAKFATARGRRLESHTCLYEKMTVLDYLRVQFSAWRTVSNRGDMHSRGEPVVADHRFA